MSYNPTPLAPVVDMEISVIISTLADQKTGKDKEESTPLTGGLEPGTESAEKKICM